jgi:MinD superfamily P-loop ATPase
MVPFYMMNERMPLKEMVVISGKGGTGKTSVLAAFAALSDRSVMADCDVDASDLHLVLTPEVERRTLFSGGVVARIDEDRCTACGACMEYCRYGAIMRGGGAGRDRRAGNERSAGTEPGEGPMQGAGEGRSTPPDAGRSYTVDGFACEGCGVCAYICPDGAVIMTEETNGEWYVSRTRHGPMVHARLKPGAENSGKLVTIVRSEASRIAEEEGYPLVLIDGSPGIGCPVIASITGADLVLVVTEPTKSGIHDLERVIELTRHFGIPAVVAVNKSDINEDMTAVVEEYARSGNIALAGRIHYDPDVTRAQMEGMSVVEVSKGSAAEDIRTVWERVHRMISRGDDGLIAGMGASLDNEQERE